MAEEEVLYGVGTLTEIKKKMAGKTLARCHDLSTQMQNELMDTVQSGIDNFQGIINMPELASKSVKQVLDKRYGPSWQVIIGEGFAYDISVQSGAYLLMYYNGNLSCLIFKT